jgi:hypothetical protein
MKTSLLTTRTRVRSAISNTTEAGVKGFSGRSFSPFLATGLALGILVAMAVNSRTHLLPTKERTSLRWTPSTRPLFKRTIRPRWTASCLTISY